jgi:hypothetical protein
MSSQVIPEADYLTRMADGTIKQVNPFRTRKSGQCPAGAIDR